MNKFFGFLAACSIAFALIGCGTDDDNSNADPMEKEAFTQAIASESCEKIFECCPNGVEGMSSLETCNTFFAPMILDSLNEGIANNMMSFDAASAGQCASEIHDLVASLSCDDLFENSPVEESAACRQAMQGLVAEGGSCEIETDEYSSQSSDDYCAGDLACLDGICTMLVEAGGSCNSDNYGEGCVEGNYCNSEGSCVPNIAPGEPCADGLNDGCEFGCEGEVCHVEENMCQ